MTGERHQFVPLNAAIDRLYDAMWGGVQRPPLVGKIKRQSRWTMPGPHGRGRGPIKSVGLESWKQETLRRLRDAICSGELTLYAVPDRTMPDEMTPTAHPAIVPIAVFKRMIGVSAATGPDAVGRLRLPERVIRPRPSLVADQPNAGELLKALCYGSLAFAVSEFAVWMNKDRAKGQWPSQERQPLAVTKPKRKGRPSVLTESLKSKVIHLVEEGAWSAQRGIPELKRLLEARFGGGVPSSDSLRRLLDRMHEREWDSRIRRRRNSSVRKVAKLPQSPNQPT